MPILPPPYAPRKASPSPKRSSSGSSSRTRTLSTRDPAASRSRKHLFSFASLRGNYQPHLSKRLFRLIKSENYVISAYESAGHERQSVATQLSEWGEQTGDDAVSELSDKLGVILTELGVQEDVFAQNLEEYRGILKQIRNTESSVQPSRDHKTKVQDEIARLKYKEPTAQKLVTLEQELVRAEAENLVAEAQLTNVTRAKLKEAYAQHFAAIVERAEKQAILAKHGRRMLNLLDDTPLIPGDTREPFVAEKDARQILLDAEEDLRCWTLQLEEVPTQAHTVVGGVLDGKSAAATSSGVVPNIGVHPALRKVSAGSSYSGSSVSSGSSSVSAANPPYPVGPGERSRRVDAISAC